MGSGDPAGSRFIAKAGGVLGAIEAVATGVSEFCLALTAVIIVADVVARYAFNSPLAWADGLAENYLLVAVVYFALGHAEAADAHVKVTIVTRLLPPRVRRWVRVITLLLSAVFFGAITVFSGDRALHAWQVRETGTGLIAWPLYVAYAIVPVGTLLMTLRLLYQAMTARVEEGAVMPGELVKRLNELEGIEA